MRSSPEFTQAGLWAWLDGAGLPFRTAVPDLVRAHGTRPVLWTDALRTVPLTVNGPFIADLADGPHLVLGPNAPEPRAPYEINAHVRRFDDARKNFAHVHGQLVPLFGQGAPGASSNTIERVWTDGYATLTVRVFPPDLNTDFGRNDRHRIIPGSATECSITIRPDWWPPLSATEQAWLTDATALDLPAAMLRFHQDFDSFSRPVMDGLGPGVWLPADKSVLILATHNRMRLVHLNLVEMLQHVVSTPARGSGGEALELRLRIGHAGAWGQSVQLVSGAYGDPVIGLRAPGVADLLNLPLKRLEYPDD